MRNPVNVGGVDGEWMFEQEQCWTYLSTIAGFNTATHVSHRAICVLMAVCVTLYTWL